VRKVLQPPNITTAIALVFICDVSSGCAAAAARGASALAGAHEGVLAAGVLRVVCGGAVAHARAQDPRLRPTFDDILRDVQLFPETF
jgi:hypothetical protein